MLLTSSTPIAACPTLFNLLPAVIITAITTDFDVFVQIFPTAELVTTAQQRLEEIQSAGATPEQATKQMYDLLVQLTGSNGQRRRLNAAPSAAGPQQQDLSVFGKIKNGTVRQVTERCDDSSKIFSIWHIAVRTG